MNECTDCEGNYERDENYEFLWHIISIPFRVKWSQNQPAKPSGLRQLNPYDALVEHYSGLLTAISF